MSPQTFFSATLEICLSQFLVSSIPYLLQKVTSFFCKSSKFFLIRRFFEPFFLFYYLHFTIFFSCLLLFFLNCFKNSYFFFPFVVCINRTVRIEDPFLIPLKKEFLQLFSFLSLYFFIFIIAFFFPFYSLFSVCATLYFSELSCSFFSIQLMYLSYRSVAAVAASLKQ